MLWIVWVLVCTGELLPDNYPSPTLNTHMYCTDHHIYTQRKLLARSDRVKCMDIHPKEPWMLASLYNGNVHVWNHESQTLVKSFEVTDLPGKHSGSLVPRQPGKEASAPGVPVSV